jgi:hypothetical protein
MEFVLAVFFGSAFSSFDPSINSGTNPEPVEKFDTARGLLRMEKHASVGDGREQFPC